MPRPEPRRAGAARRRYLCNGFALEIPAAWRDVSFYAFQGPELKGFRPTVGVQVEENLRDPDIERFARPRLERQLRAASNARLTRRERVRLAGGVVANRAEIRAFTPDENRSYHRLLFAVANDAGFLLSAALTRHARLAIGSGIDAVMASLRFPIGEAPLKDEWIRAGRFALKLPEGWTDESLVMFAEPDRKRFRRTLTVRRATGEAAAPDEAEWAKAEIEILAESVPGFELLSHKETVTLDGASAQLLSFRRNAGKKDALLHTGLLAWRGAARFTAIATTEAAPPKAIERALVPMLRSLAAPPEGRPDGSLRV